MTHTASFSESPESELNFENVILFFSYILMNCADLIYDFLKKKKIIANNTNYLRIIYKVGRI